MRINDDSFDEAAKQVLEPADPMDAAAASVVDDQRTQLRASLYDSLLANPDVAARAVYLGRKANLPPDVVERNLDTVQRDVQLNEFDAFLADSPHLANFLGIPQNAKMAYDDTEALQGIERMVRGPDVGSIGPIVGPEPGLGSVLRGLVSAIPQAGRAARAGLTMQYADLFGLEGLRREAEREYSGVQLDRQMTTPAFESSTAQGLYGGVDSTLRLLPGLAASLASRTPSPLLASLGVQTEAEAYTKYRTRGATPGEALVGGVGEAAVELGTEALPMGFLVNRLGKVGAGEFLKGLLARELPTEQLATVLQDALDTAIANPDKTWLEYAQERPDAAYQTLVSTVTQASIMGGAHVTLNRYAGRAQQAQTAEQNAAALTVLNDLATNSKLRARDPDTFQAFVAQALEDGPVSDVYLNAQTLAQSGVDVNALARASPAVAEQLADALETGGDIRIPVDEFTARIAGTDFAQALIPHLKTDPAGLTQAEAQTFMQSGAEELQADIEKTLAERQGDDAFKASRDVVTEQLRAELADAGRFTDDVNTKYATLVANFYATMGAKLGKTAEQMAEQYPLAVRAQSVAGARGFDQGSRRFSEDNRLSNLSMGGPSWARIRENNKALAKVSSPDADVTIYRATVGDNIHPDDFVAVDRAVAEMELENVRDRDGGGRIIEQRVKVRDLLMGNDATEFVYFPEGGANTDTFNQGQRAPRGSIAFGDDITQTPSIISLLEKADLSTFLHEAGHFFLEVNLDIATRLAQTGINQTAPDDVQGLEAWFGSRAILDDTNALLKWFGVDSLDAWQNLDFEQRREYHEKFARGFEAYLFEGKAPSVELNSLFQRFRAWLLNVYRSLLNLNVPLNDEVRAVMARMLASSEAIAEAETVRNYGGLFDTKPEFMTDQEWLTYQGLAQDATQEAIHGLESRSLRDMKWLSNAKSRKLKELQAKARGARAEVRREAETEVMAEPVNQAREFLKRGILNGEKVKGGFKLYIPEIEAVYADSGAVSTIKETLGYGKYGMLGTENGIHPDQAAELFGFTSGDQLVRELLSAEDPQAKIDALTDQRMLERYGDLIDERAVARAVDAALHNDLRARVLATEINALNKAIGQRPILAKAAKQFAEATIARLKLREIKPGQYNAQAARAAKNASEAFRKGEIQTAAVEKRNQLVHTYAAKAAQAAQDEVEKGVRYLTKFDREGPRKGLDADYLEQIDRITERFDLRRGQSLKAIDKRTTLAKWIQGQEEAGLEPDVPEWLQDEAARAHFKNLTLEEFRGVVDSVKQIEHLGRLKKRLLTAKDQRELDAIVKEISDGLETNSGGRVVNNEVRNTLASRASAQFRGALASHRKASFVAREMDGGKDGGPLWNYLIRSMNEAGDREATMRAEATGKLYELAKPVLAGEPMGGKGRYFPGLGRSLNRGERLAIALNWGNDSNRQRLLGGRGWTPAQVQPVLDTLTATDWQFVQGVWDFFEGYRPEIAAKQKRVYGTEPDWIEAVPLAVATADGKTLNLRGGYYPVKYDPRQSGRAGEHADAEAAKAMLRAAYTAATTRRSFTKSRSEEVHGRPLLLSFDGIWQGANEVIHDLAWHEWLIDANRLMRRLDKPMRTHYGADAVDVFKKVIKDTARGDLTAANNMERALNHLRTGATVAGLGWNVTAALMQPLGLTQSIVRVGGKWIAKGIGQFYTAPIEQAREVQAKSEFMRNRSRTMNREINDVRNQIVEGKGKIRTNLEASYFVFIHAMQSTVDYPTWLAGYEKAIADNPADEDRAIALADQAVIDAQGSGQIKDLAEVQRGHPAWKLFTNFYSYFNTTLNLAIERAQATDFKNPRQVGALTVDYLLLLVVPAVMSSLLRSALRGEDDEEKVLKNIAQDQVGYLLGLFVGVRELTGGAQLLLGVGDPGAGYPGPAGLRFFSEVYKLGQQINQGEVDMTLFKAANNAGGIILHYPAGQVNRTVEGAAALLEGRTQNPLAPLTGAPPNR